MCLPACKKDTEVTQVDIGYNYFPDEVGSFVIYDVDSLYYNDFTSKIDTFKFQIKEKITENFSDLSSRTTQRVERFYRKNASEIWDIKDVWFANKTSNTAEKVEENIRLVKLVFPLKENLKWNGNRYNNLGEQNYSLKNFNTQYSVGTLKFDSTLTVLQLADSNLIEKKYAYEVYAKNIGLIVKRSIHLADNDSIINFTLPLEKRAKSGFDLCYKAIAFGKE